MFFGKLCRFCFCSCMQECSFPGNPLMQCFMRGCCLHVVGPDQAWHRQEGRTSRLSESNKVCDLKVRMHSVHDNKLIVGSITMAFGPFVRILVARFVGTRTRRQGLDTIYRPGSDWNGCWWSNRTGSARIVMSLARTGKSYPSAKFEQVLEAYKAGFV